MDESISKAVRLTTRSASLRSSQDFIYDSENEIYAREVVKAWYCESSLEEEKCLIHCRPNFQVADTCGHTSYLWISSLV